MKLGVVDAVLWVLGAIGALFIAIPLVAALVPSAGEDLVTMGAVQSAVYLGVCSLFAARRAGRSWSALFALRRTSAWLVVLGLALGVLLYVPAASLAGWLESLAPLDAADRARREAQLEPRSLAHAVALFTVVAGLGVFGEELLFRGALYTGLRPRHSTGAAIVNTSLLFTITHPEPRFWAALFLVALVLGLVRAASGSLWPSLFLHAAFNATALGMPKLGPRLQEPGAELVAASAAGAALSLTLFLKIGRASAAAGRARSADLETDEGLGEARS